MKVLITGASGLLGSAIGSRLNAAGHEITKTSRRAGQGSVIWQVQKEPAPAAAIDGTDVIIHLAGEPIASGRWTEERKVRIRDSRARCRHFSCVLQQLDFTEIGETKN